MENIYNFLKQKLKERNVRVDELVRKSGVSRTTIYRVMKGILRPAPNVYDIIVETLRLNEEEQQQLIKLISQIDVNESQLNARNELHKIFYKKNVVDDVENIEFIVYEEEKFLKKYDEVLKIIQKASENKDVSDFKLEIKILNCIEDTYIAPFTKFVQSLENLNKWSIEHLIDFSKENSYNNILVLKTISPLIMYSNYNVLFSDVESDLSHKHIFPNIMLIKYSAINGDKYMIMSFEKGTAFSDCFITGDEKLYDFFLKKYKNVKKYYQNTLLRHSNLEYFHDFIVEFEESGDRYLLKNDICYSKIPAYLYKEIFSRAIKQNEKMKTLFKDVLDGGYSFENTLDNLLVELKRRNDLSLEFKQVEVYTKNGLEAFAKKRRLSDAFDFLPDLTKNEVKLIFEYVKAKNNAPNDKFEFYIVDTDMAIDNLIFIFNSCGGVAVEYINSNYADGNVLNCYLEHSHLSQAAIDFIENYIPENLAMSQTEADKFIDYLIATYC